MPRILEILSVRIAMTKKRPPQILLHVKGRVTSSGWSHPELGAWYYISPPEDGIQDLDFTADAPGPHTPVVMHDEKEIEPTLDCDLLIPIDPANYWGEGKPLRGIRVHSIRNSIVARIDGRQESFPEARSVTSVQGGNLDPWPWAVLTAQGLNFPLDTSQININNETKVSELLGRELRVYSLGDTVTLDWRPDRVNVVLKTGTRIIHEIKAG